MSLPAVPPTAAVPSTGQDSGTCFAGRGIASTVATMSMLGSLGRQVLIEYGIVDIDLDGWYPFQLRRSMHDAAFRRFGEEALYAFGLANVNFFADTMQLVRAANDQYREAVREATRHAQVEDALATLFERNVAAFDDAVRGSVRSHFDGFGASSVRLGPTLFELEITSISAPAHEAFQRGIMSGMLTQFIADQWQFELRFDPSRTRHGEDWTRFVWTCEFRWQPTGRSNAEMSTALMVSARDALLNKVLAESDAQRAVATEALHRLEALSAQLAKYLPPQIRDALVEGRHDTRIATRRKKLTVFFSDIKGFTQTSESLQPEALTEYLNEYFSEMTRIALEHGATIDKYMGDAMMVFFGDPESRGVREDARACVLMALRMQERLQWLQQRWRAQGFENPFEIRIGINTGYCNVGNFGSDQRISYTIVGAEVNLAQRLEANADAGGILMSYETWVNVRDLVDAEEREAIRMKGIGREVRTYAVRHRRAAEQPRLLELEHPAGISVRLQSDTLDPEERRRLADHLDALSRSLREGS
ncbi:MAG: adenylate/guanylate cyclase domain-containing protein [Burkholderiaceae bacterium]|nr:adenylate/guanylate cyclase domain-containing protein [Burkholderiaceae bacterium]